MEKWLEIEGYEGYFISNHGRVKSVNKKYKGEYIHKERLNADGYPKATLRKDNKACDYRIHRLVATHFIPNVDNLETVNHKDGNKTNNRVDNLEWSDRKSQLKHAYKLKLKIPVKGELNGNSTLTNAQADEIRKQYVKQSRKFGTVALGKKYGVYSSVIQRIVTNKSYR